ncbi:MAG: hypothetical protein Hyperionvirus48_4 [Hyperionvirus sp.]|uniref:Uncharacterized protein n=1 Tax=Hyperionvirus sp. TaxID=2487770 RepID=A0A3G5AHJ7_9VIRU|nr:MAG: hypothetical protein Hyperionvirus48_4 [Hyperionvirus sp.]
MAEETKETKVYVPCYNCTGANTKTWCCGSVLIGCILCKTHGTGDGKLLIEFSKIAVTIADGAGLGETQTFQPPAYSCLHCKDSKKMTYTIYDPAIAEQEPVSTDFNDSLMPRVEVSCHGCLPDQYKIEVDQAKMKYFATTPTV